MLARRSVIAACLAGLTLAASTLVASDADRALAAPGSLDPSFAGGGVVRTRMPGASASAEAVLIRPDGKIVTASVMSSPNRGVGLARYRPGGRLDPSFGGGDGKLVSPINATVTDAALAPGGKIVVSLLFRTKQTFQGRFAILRFHPDGGLDRSFGTDGRVTTPFDDFSSTSWTVTVADDGKILAAGEMVARDGNDVDLAVARYRTGGELDPSFSQNGIARISIDGAYPTGWDVAQAEDGAIVVAGEARDASGNDGRGLVARFRPNGSLDPSFSTNGWVRVSSANADRYNGIAVMANRKIVATGGTATGASAARFTADGALDPSFSGDGVVTMPAPTIRTWAVAIAAGGSPVIGGQALSGSDPVVSLHRFTAAGLPDPAFGGGDGEVISDLGGSALGARGIVLQPDGRIVVAVDSDRFPKTSRAVTARYLG